MGYGSTIYVGAPTGTAQALAVQLNGQVRDGLRPAGLIFKSGEATMINSPMSEILKIDGSGWSLEVWPALGGALVAARARHGQSWVDVTRPVTPADIAARDIRKMGSFVLAPFCNRLEGGQFTYDGVNYRVPLNWPPDPGVAIHGLAWQRPWIVEGHAESRIDLVQHFAEEGVAFRYDARLSYDLTTDAAVTTLSIRNAGDRTLPFGLGFHPYFRRSAAAAVQFGTDGWFEPDARCLPIGWHPLDAAKDVRSGLPVAALAGLDVSFTGWTRQAMLTWPEIAARLVIEANDAAKVLHVYVPRQDPGIICLEPVTHVIDVLNRRQFARYGDMVPLAPGAELSLSMRWRLQSTDERLEPRSS